MAPCYSRSVQVHGSLVTRGSVPWNSADCRARTLSKEARRRADARLRERSSSTRRSYGSDAYAP